MAPFKVAKRIGENAYQLDLPERYGKLHHTFHVSLLEPYVRREGEEPPGPVDIEKEKFLVENILDERTKQGKPEFLIKWLGYPEHESTWEPLEHLDELEDEIADFRMRRAVASRAEGKITTRKRRKESRTESQRRPRGRPRKGGIQATREAKEGFKGIFSFQLIVKSFSSFGPVRGSSET